MPYYEAKLFEDSDCDFEYLEDRQVVYAKNSDAAAVKFRQKTNHLRYWTLIKTRDFYKLLQKDDEEDKLKSLFVVIKEVDLKRTPVRDCVALVLFVTIAIIPAIIFWVSAIKIIFGKMRLIHF